MKINRDRMSRELVDAGNKLQGAKTEQEKHAAAVELLQLRLAYCTGHEDPARTQQIQYVCAALSASDVTDLIEWMWSSYLGGLQHMKDTTS